MRKFQNRCVSKSLMLTGLLLLGLSLGSSAWATETPTQGMVTQIQNYSATGEIYEAAAAEDLIAMLVSVDKAVSAGDNVAAQDLLVPQMSSKSAILCRLIETEGAQQTLTT